MVLAFSNAALYQSSGDLTSAELGPGVGEDCAKEVAMEGPAAAADVDDDDDTPEDGAPGSM